MESKKNLAKYLVDYLDQEVSIAHYPLRGLDQIILNGIEAFEAGAFDGNEYEIVIDKVTRKV